MRKIDLEILGERIKKLRLKKEISIRSLAKDIGVSPSLLSQIERGIANPSLTTLRLISKSLEVPMFSLFVEEEASAILVKKDRRVKITNGANDDKIKVTYDLLSPDMKGDIQMCEMDLKAGSRSASKLNSHIGEEVAICIFGNIELVLENKTYLLKEGDSIRIAASTPHYWNNPTNEECRIIFAITPPSF